MFEIIVNNREIILTEKSKLSLKYNSPLLHDAEATGTYSLTLQAPVCAENNITFNHNNEPAKALKNRQYNFDLNIARNYFDSGILVLRKINSEYEFNLNIGSAELVAKCGKINLKDIAWGSYTLPRTTGTKAFYPMLVPEKYPTGEAFSTDQSTYKDTFVLTVTSTQFLFNFSIFAYIYFQNDLDSTLKAIAKKVNDTFANFQCGYKDRYFFFSADAYEEGMSFTLYIYRADNVTAVNSATITLLSDTNTKFYASELNNPLPEYNNFVFPMIHNSKFYDGKKKSSVWINQYISPNYLRNTVDRYSVDNLFTLVPMLKLRFILDKIFQKIGMTYSGVIQYGDISTLILYSNYALDKPNPNLPFLNTHDELVDYIKLVPSMKIIDFLQRLKTMFGLYFVIENNNVEFKFRIDRIREPNEDVWTEKEQSSSNELKELKNYVLKFEDSLNYAANDGTIGYDFFQDFKVTNPIQSVENKEEIISAFGTLHKHQYGNVSIDNIKGNSPMFDLGTTNPTPLRLLFWNGVTTVGANTFPSGTQSSGTTDLVFQGAKGLYERFWKEYIEMLMKGESYTKTVNLSYTDLLALLMDRKKRFENIQFLVSELNISIGNGKDTMDDYASGEFLKI